MGFDTWGVAIHERRAADVAFAVARWFAKGGSLMSYYMWFGGNAFVSVLVLKFCCNMAFNLL